MPSSADFGVALGEAAAAICAALTAAASRAPRAVIDGQSGSGKSVLAAELVARSAGHFQLVALDDLYPGWDGLAAGAVEALRRVVEPHAAGVVGRWRRWDWERSAWAEEHVVDPDRPLLIEGAGALTAEVAALVDVSIWLDSPEVSRKKRALDRDGETYRPHWERWASQEALHIATHRPQTRATLVFALP